MLDDEASDPGEVDVDDYTFLGFHTILLVFGGVAVGFGASPLVSTLFYFSWVVRIWALEFLLLGFVWLFALTSF